MTSTEPLHPHFDVRVSLRRRNITRLIVAPALSIGLILLGTWLVPNTTVFRAEVEAIESWTAWSFVGSICILSGAFGLLKELAFAVRAFPTDGEWHFMLTETDLQWHVPTHAHGAEVGFTAELADIEQVEFRTIERHDAQDTREYWIHVVAREPVQLQAYSGVSLYWLVEKICATGVPYKETVEAR